MDTLEIFCIATGAAATLSLLALFAFSVSKKKSPAARRLSLIFVGVFGIAAVTGCVYLADRDPNLPTLTQMQTGFGSQRAQLEKLQQMSDEDKRLTGIAADYITAIPTSDSPNAMYKYGDPRSPLAKARWDVYKGLLEPLGSLATIERSGFGDVTIYTWNGPWRGLYRTVGYIHCAAAPSIPATGSTFRSKPCGDAALGGGMSQGEMSGDTVSHAHFSNVVPLIDGWYAFESGID